MKRYSAREKDFKFLFIDTDRKITAKTVECFRAGFDCELEGVVMRDYSLFNTVNLNYTHYVFVIDESFSTTDSWKLFGSLYENFVKSKTKEQNLTEYITVITYNRVVGLGCPSLLRPKNYIGSLTWRGGYTNCLSIERAFDEAKRAIEQLKGAKIYLIYMSNDDTNKLEGYANSIKRGNEQMEFIHIKRDEKKSITELINELNCDKQSTEINFSIIDNISLEVAVELRDSIVKRVLAELISKVEPNETE